MAKETTAELKLRTLEPHDAPAFQTLLQRLPSDMPTFLHGYRNDMSFASYLAHLEIRATEQFVHDATQVPETMLFAFLGDAIIGRVSLRHRLTPALEQLAGHIGYAILPSWRGRGLATLSLKLALTFARTQLGLERVLVTCDATNLASRRVIEQNGGVLENSVRVTGAPDKLRYWIATQAQSPQ